MYILVQHDIWKAEIVELKKMASARQWLSRQAPDGLWLQASHELILCHEWEVGG
jgi:hypothetical protein